MIIESQYVYITTVLVGLIPSIIFFFKNKKYRMDMIRIGLVMGVCSLVTACLFWTKDWWFPLTITNTVIGIEDFILGFDTGALAVIINSTIFLKEERVTDSRNWKIIFSTISFFMISMFVAFYILMMSSFISFVISSLISIAWIYYKAKISPIQSLVFAVTYAILSLWSYFFIFLINKDWIYTTWDINLLSGITIFNFIPIEEFIFWVLFGIIFKQIYIAHQN